jgi:glycosyltransferase involved in cell wall biosynthesis
MTVPISKKLRVASFIASMGSGGIGPVCDYAARALAKETRWEVTLVSIMESARELDVQDGSYRACGLDLRSDCARGLLRWLQQNPQDVLITSGVSELEPAFPFLPREVHHIVHLHDSGRRYRNTALKYAPFLQGVVCVARHIEERLALELRSTDFRGVLRTIHNGVDFPPCPERPRPHASAPLELLFMGRLDPMKGISDLVPLLQGLKRRMVPVRLNIVGKVDPDLRSRIAQEGCADMVAWHGFVSRSRCFEIAATCDVFLMLSRKEPFGMVVIETMSMGCIPVAYDVPSGPREIVIDGESGVIVPFASIKALINELALLQADLELRERLSKAADARAREAFGAGRLGREFADLISSTLEKAQTSGVSRLDGEPPLTNLTSSAPPSGYGRVPLHWRLALRRWVGAQPHLCHWLLDR